MWGEKRIAQMHMSARGAEVSGGALSTAKSIQKLGFNADGEILILHHAGC